MQILIIDSDKTTTDLLSKEFKSLDYSYVCIDSASKAIKFADKNKPDAVITELTLPGHSGTEFIYEFRTYKDWSSVPIIIFSSVSLSKRVTDSRDWKLLNIYNYLQKSKNSIKEVVDSVIDAVNNEAN